VRFLRFLAIWAYLVLSFLVIKTQCKSTKNKLFICSAVCGWTQLYLPRLAGLVKQNHSFGSVVVSNGGLIEPIQIDSFSLSLPLSPSFQTLLSPFLHSPHSFFMVSRSRATLLGLCPIIAALSICVHVGVRISPITGDRHYLSHSRSLSQLTSTARTDFSVPALR
jgi:hypothetical protein